MQKELLEILTAHADKLPKAVTKIIDSYINDKYYITWFPKWLKKTNLNNFDVFQNFMCFMAWQNSQAAELFLNDKYCKMLLGKRIRFNLRELYVKKHGCVSIATDNSDDSTVPNDGYELIAFNSPPKKKKSNIKFYFK